MALFGSKKENKTAPSASPESVSVPSAARDLASVIKKPRITEKAMISTEKNVYVFEVQPSATKYDVRDAVKAIFGVTPVKVRTVTKQPRRVLSRVRRRRSTESGIKKAYVYLKEGDTINLV